MAPVRVVSFDVGTTHLGVWAGEFTGSVERGDQRFPFRFEHWELIDLETQLLRDVTERLHHELDRRPFLCDDYDWVLIENQIDDLVGGGRGNAALYKVGRMKAVGAVIHSYFYGRRRARGDPNVGRILYVSARGKLKVYRGDDAHAVVAPRASQHERNKALAVAHVQAMLTDAADELGADGAALLDWFLHVRNARGSLKRDDVADAFLQAAYWCIKKTGWRTPGTESPHVATTPALPAFAFVL